MKQALAVLAALAVALPAHAADDALIGLWRYRQVSEPALHGPIAITDQGHMWRATIAGRSASSEAIGADVRLVFPDRLGEFRGHLAGQRLQGYWLQPGHSGAGNGQPFASPVSLSPAGPGRWRGDVRPLPRTFTLWLKVFRDADGALVGAFRNPEQNSIGGRTQFLVARDGEAVHFTSRPQPGRTPVALDATLADGALTLPWPDTGGSVSLKPATPAEAAPFYPRPPEAPAYRYAPPPPLNDGWPVARAASVGLDEAALAAIVRDQAAADPAAARPQLMHSILVARHGKLALEEYFFGFGRTTPHDLRSAAKSFNAVMLGAAMRRDQGLGPQSRAYDLLSARGPFANPDPRKAGITLAHLMTHTSGLACDDNDDASPGNEETMQAQTGQPDWAKYTLDLPMAHDPGARYAYCSANANLVAAALAARTGTWLPRLFDETVARPLRFGRWFWTLTPTGDGYGGGGVELTPRDFLKVGQAWLDGGTWKGRRIADAAWVRLSTAPHADITPQTTGLSDDAFAEAYIRAQDGYAWHLNKLKTGDRVYDDYEATGNGGQLLIVVPAADVVVAITAGNYGQGGIWTRWRDTLVAQQILTHLR